LEEILTILSVMFVGNFHHLFSFYGLTKHQLCGYRLFTALTSLIIVVIGALCPMLSSP